MQMLNKFLNVKNYKINIIIKNNIKELKNIVLENLTITQLEKLAVKIFSNYHTTNTFQNNKNIITVNRKGIYESIQKIYHTRNQRNLIKEHLNVLYCLGKIIENATLVNQVLENKGRIKYKSWNYYLNGVIIENKKYIIEFEVVSMDNKENHYHLQRLKLIKDI